MREQDNFGSKTPFISMGLKMHCDQMREKRMDEKHEKSQVRVIADFMYVKDELMCPEVSRYVWWLASEA